jgi:hypothetical protein
MIAPRVTLNVIAFVDSIQATVEIPRNATTKNITSEYQKNRLIVSAQIGALRTVSIQQR